jgi:hypothetical protein
MTTGLEDQSELNRDEMSENGYRYIELVALSIDSDV